MLANKFRFLIKQCAEMPQCISMPLGLYNNISFPLEDGRNITFVIKKDLHILNNCINYIILEANNNWYSIDLIDYYNNKIDCSNAFFDNLLLVLSECGFDSIIVNSIANFLEYDVAVNPLNIKLDSLSLNAPVISGLETGSSETGSSETGSSETGSSETGSSEGSVGKPVCVTCGSNANNGISNINDIDLNKPIINYNSDKKQFKILISRFHSDIPGSLTLHVKREFEYNQLLPISSGEIYHHNFISFLNQLKHNCILYIGAPEELTIFILNDEQASQVTSICDLNFFHLSEVVQQNAPTAVGGEIIEFLIGSVSKEEFRCIQINETSFEGSKIMVYMPHNVADLVLYPSIDRNKKLEFTVDWITFKFLIHNILTL